MAEEYYSDIC